ncbi:regakine-1-like [Fundulus heteroclitus]|uniref:regakine-1-like n=1 Tax=Fundulus heteroclitus TaxID=8078 RepID=UPI00165AB176|nr:regakine-1-like [Fundulus heteroclitus]
MISIKVTVMVATLVTLCILSTDTHAAHMSCCRRHMVGRIPFSDIKGFSVQKITELCPISAIIFHTKKGKRCANPALAWVMDYVSRLENMALDVHQKAQEKD